MSLRRHSSPTSSSDGFSPPAPPPHQGEHQLLGISYDWQGVARLATPEEMSLRHRSLPRDQLPRLLQSALQRQAQRSDGLRVCSILSAVRTDEPPVSAQSALTETL
jgi:hypothetical protein